MGKKIVWLINRQTRMYRNGDTELDLSYIMPNIIGMSFPASGPRSLFMNNIDDVARYLDEVHGNNYLVFNLCSEMAYPGNKFHGRAVRCPMDDYQPPPFDIIKPFCEQADQWLRSNPSNVIAVHCKAGKGRTGAMICCFLLYKRYYNNADDALKHFTSKRMKTDAIPMRCSQRRYVEYFCRLLHEPFDYRPVTLRLGAVELDGRYLSSIGSAVYFTVSQRGIRGEYHSRTVSTSKLFRGRTEDRLILAVPEADRVLVTGDVKICVMSAGYRTRKLFSFWFNTHFVGGPTVALPSADNFHEHINDITGQPHFRQASCTGANWSVAPYSIGLHANPAPAHSSKRPGSACLVSVVNVGQTEPTTAVDFRSGSVGILPHGGVCSNQFRVISLHGAELDMPIGSPGWRESLPDNFKVKVYLSPNVS